MQPLNAIKKEWKIIIPELSYICGQEIKIYKDAINWTIYAEGWMFRVIWSRYSRLQSLNIIDTWNFTTKNVTYSLLNGNI